MHLLTRGTNLVFEKKSLGLKLAQSLSNVLIHTIFSTKDRLPYLTLAIQSEMHAYLAKICQSLGCFVFKIGGVEDHIHLFTTLPRTLSQSSFAEEVKTSSSKWIKSKHPDFETFSWQKGFGIFSICPTHVDALKHYISNQAIHHKEIDFKTEFLTILRKNNVSFNEEYLWN